MIISISATINSDINTVWNAWTESEHITHWNFASDEWHCPTAKIDLKSSGSFSYRMEAKDGSFGFDFAGKFISVIDKKLITYSLDDERIVDVEFSNNYDSVTITQTFESEDQNSAEQQRAGWQAILDNFKKYVESK